MTSAAANEATEKYEQSLSRRNNLTILRSISMLPYSILIFRTIVIPLPLCPISSTDPGRLKNTRDESWKIEYLPVSSGDSDFPDDLRGRAPLPSSQTSSGKFFI